MALTRLPWRHVHLVGVGGTGLSAIARVLWEQGIHVSGCDRQDGPTLQALAAAGMPVFVGHDPHHVEEAEALLVTSAVREDHPEVQAARARGIPVLRRREFLPYLLAGRKVIAVAGTHGKTTTTGMIVHLLRSAGYDVGYIVGSTLPRWGNAAAGREPTFVIEADEYDYMFWGIEPAVAVVTNVEWDHVDCFPTPEAYREAFAGFVARARTAVVVNAEDEGALAVAQASQVPVTTFALHGTADWTASLRGRSRKTGGFRFRALRNGEPVTGLVVLSVPGYHNARNALAALAALDAAGYDVAALAPLLNTYEGATRRFQVKGEVSGVLVIDDYAHHPTEVRATLEAARLLFPKRRIWAVFQPHTYSRTKAFLKAWRGAFAAADVVVVMDIYPARETDTLGIDGATVAVSIGHPQVMYTGSVQTTVKTLRAHVRPGDVVITLGAGTSTDVAEGLVAALEERKAYVRP